MELEDWLRTDRGQFYSLVAWEVYSHEWGELTDSQREHIIHLADTLAAALGVGWTSQGSIVRPPLPVAPDESVLAPQGEATLMTGG